MRSEFKHFWVFFWQIFYPMLKFSRHSRLISALYRVWERAAGLEAPRLLDKMQEELDGAVNPPS